VEVTQSGYLISATPSGDQAADKHCWPAGAGHGRTSHYRTYLVLLIYEPRLSPIDRVTDSSGLGTKPVRKGAS